MFGCKSKATQALVSNLVRFSSVLRIIINYSSDSRVTNWRHQLKMFLNRMNFYHFISRFYYSAKLARMARFANFLSFYMQRLNFKPKTTLILTTQNTLPGMFKQMSRPHIEFHITFIAFKATKYIRYVPPVYRVKENQQLSMEFL